MAKATNEIVLKRTLRSGKSNYRSIEGAEDVEGMRGRVWRVMSVIKCMM